ncbi:uncharacterized protein LOC132463588 isoform X1 [Gadus macrocephalus]|uniref:uncharacterized protein LOC132463588 isoform X1 n=2 Tax=Gadus macrocephalus TaxID=80720 RepID=UPI0028CB7875|nr:uncharacterized protein LOC132463588 isoform X1 [Gadus macrocephalus]
MELPINMAKRAAYFSDLDLQVLLESYDEEKGVIMRKCNTKASAIMRNKAWQRIADRVNSCNPTAPKRTREQVKMKYKNVVQAANRKRADSRQTGSGPPITFTPVEELALTINAGRPGMEGIPGGTSSESPGPSPSTVNPLVEYQDGVLLLIEPATNPPVYVSPEADENIAMDGSERTETVVEEAAGTSGSQYQHLTTKELYRLHLQREIAKADLQMEYTKLLIEVKKRRLGRNSTRT